MRKFDDFNDRHGKNNPHDHNDNYYEEEITNDDKCLKFGKNRLENSEDSRLKYDNRFVIMDIDGKVLSEINGEINYFDTVDMEDGGFSVAVKFDDKRQAQDFMEDELDKFPDLELEVVPVKEAFAFLEESKCHKTENSAKEMRVYIIHYEELDEVDSAQVDEALLVLTENYKSENIDKNIAQNFIADMAEEHGEVMTLENFIREFNKQRVDLNSEIDYIYIGEAIQ